MSVSVCVVGSIRMDFVVHASRFVQPGEILHADDFVIHPSGKGANQAVAASRMGADVTLIGCVGDDEWGSEMRGVLASAGVDLHAVRTCEKCHTGVGFITVVPGGANSIVSVPGANAQLSPEDIEGASRSLGEADVLVLQNEVSLETNLRAIEYVERPKTMVLYNASPAGEVHYDLLKLVDLLVVNQAEARQLVGDEEGDISPTGLARRLSSLGPERVVVTLGGQGAVHFNGEKMRTFEAQSVECLDITAAGDAFVGAMAVLRGNEARLEESVRYACAAGSLASTRQGAIPSLPTQEEVETFMGEMKSPA